MARQITKIAGLATKPIANWRTGFAI